MNHTVPGTKHSIALGNMNSDYLFDIVAANESANNVSVLTANGAGGFNAAVNYAAGDAPQFAALGDLNNDGRPDITVANANSGDVSVLLGSGAGGFATTRHFGASGAPRSAAVADLDANGMPDILAASDSNNSIVILMNLSAPPPGILAFGPGTPGCRGGLGMGANAPPAVNNTNFGMTASNAPPTALGVLLVTDSPDFAGGDLFGYNFKLHVDFLYATEVFAFDIISDAGGSAFAATPIPNIPELAGNLYYAQSIFLEPAGASCGPALYGLVATRALQLTIQ